MRARLTLARLSAAYLTAVTAAYCCDLWVPHTCTVPPLSTSPHPSPPSLPMVGTAHARANPLSHPDPVDSSTFFCSIRATTHGARSDQLTCMLSERLERARTWGATVSHLSAVSQHPPTKKDAGTCAGAMKIHGGCSRLLRPQNISMWSHSSQTPQTGAQD